MACQERNFRVFWSNFPGYGLLKSQLPSWSDWIHIIMLPKSVAYCQLHWKTCAYSGTVRKYLAPPGNLRQTCMIVCGMFWLTYGLIRPSSNELPSEKYCGRMGPMHLLQSAQSCRRIVPRLELTWRWYLIIFRQLCGHRVDPEQYTNSMIA